MQLQPMNYYAASTLAVSFVNGIRVNELKKKIKIIYRRVIPFSLLLNENRGSVHTYPRNLLIIR